MTGKITINGKDYPVTAKFQMEVLDKHPDLADRAQADLELLRQALMRLSTARYNLEVPVPPDLAPNSMLTAKEKDRLDCITHVFNVHNAVKFLQGRDHTDFGFAGIDQVHGNRHDLECGCVKHVVFDHHKRGEKDLVLHPHGHPHDRACDKHKQ